MERSPHRKRKMADGSAEEKFNCLSTKKVKNVVVNKKKRLPKYFDRG